MPPEERLLPRFVAEPPQEPLPYGRWAQRLSEEFLAACLALSDESEEDLGEPGEVAWYPDRTWHGRTFVPASATTAGGYELFGFVRFVPGAGPQDEPSDFHAFADFTAETAARNPGWTLDLCEQAIGAWRGEAGAVATMTLVWGRPLLGGGQIATAELADLAVDQCALIEERFTLLAPDDYRGDLLEIKLFAKNGRQLARESLYEEEGGESEEEEEKEEEPEAKGEEAAHERPSGSA